MNPSVSRQHPILRKQYRYDINIVKPLLVGCLHLCSTRNGFIVDHTSSYRHSSTYHVIVPLISSATILPQRLGFVLVTVTPSMSSWRIYCQLIAVMAIYIALQSLQLCHNDSDGVSNHQRHDCLLNRLFKRRSKKTWKLRVTGHCEGNSPATVEFPAQRVSNAENVSIWWRHHVKCIRPTHCSVFCGL